MVRVLKEQGVGYFCGSKESLDETGDELIKHVPTIKSIISLDENQDTRNQQRQVLSCSDDTPAPTLLSNAARNVVMTQQRTIVSNYIQHYTSIGRFTHP